MRDLAQVRGAMGQKETEQERKPYLETPGKGNPPSFGSAGLENPPCKSGGVQLERRLAEESEPYLGLIQDFGDAILGFWSRGNPWVRIMKIPRGNLACWLIAEPQMLV
jgi:hypothetical protein